MRIIDWSEVLVNLSGLEELTVIQVTVHEIGEPVGPSTALLLRQSDSICTVLAGPAPSSNNSD
jgi:hypothetical protein